MQQVFDWLGYWLAVDAPGTVETFHDFTLAPSAELARLLLELARDQIISRETVWAWLKSAGMLPSSFDEDRELYLLENSIFGDLQLNNKGAVEPALQLD